MAMTERMYACAGSKCDEWCVVDFFFFFWALALTNRFGLNTHPYMKRKLGYP